MTNQSDPPPEPLPDRSSDKDDTDDPSPEPPKWGDGGRDATTPESASTCPSGHEEVGRHAIWPGKVNVYRPTGGSWAVDDSCHTGANVAGMEYCQQHWPATAVAVVLPSVTSELKPFTEMGLTSLAKPPKCDGEIYHDTGKKEYLCCAPQ